MVFGRHAREHAWTFAGNPVRGGFIGDYHRRRGFGGGLRIFILGKKIRMHSDLVRASDSLAPGACRRDAWNESGGG